MQRVLCFGDSNTWGYRPDGQGRFATDIRWTGLTPLLLNNEFDFYEAGLNGRTTDKDEQDRDFRNGSALLPLYLESCRPLDWVIIMLGTNDLKTSLQRSLQDIVDGVRLLCEQVAQFDYAPYKSPKILLVVPPPLNELAMLEPEFVSSVGLSRRLAPAYFKLCQELDIEFLDAGRVIKSSETDGVHWDADSHRDFANHLAAVLKNTHSGDK